ncbi:MAG TPA: phosphoglucosamine mutase [Acidimicrobiales bacterium]|nr:phosphoglucosamine mutase [Acidimicrobiales bacterium]
MTLRFGTDGVRGVANLDLTPELVVALGRAAARVLGGDCFLVGRDTRVSGPMLQAALSAGLTAEGADVADLGVLPTPGVAWVSAAESKPAAMISASHNPFPDNGIKFFAPGGRKLSDEAEGRLEAELDRLLAAEGAGPAGPTGADLGGVRDHDGRERYAEALGATLGGRRLDGLSVVVDCAHGAAYSVAPAVLSSLGVDVTVVNDRPDGTNINLDAGSQHPEGLARAVVARGADAGLAFDGDADRVVAVDHTGAVVDGDQLIAICALDLRSRGRLADDTVVVTVMANLGFRQAMAAHGVTVVETQVGDRYVLEELERGGWSLGGEQSGHVIFRDLATTGDGILTGLQVLDVMCRTGRRLHDLSQVMTRLPQVLRNVTVADRHALERAVELGAEVESVRRRMGDKGRVLIRPSGTEPVVRVMVEALTLEEAEATCAELCAAVSRSLGGPAAAS